MSVWRTPDEESVDVYPGLTVHDGRVSGSITIGRTRLPLWAVVGEVIRENWDSVEYYYGPTSWSEAEFLTFLANLLDLRGEFARLLCTLADVERLESIREETALKGCEGLVDVTPGVPGAVQPPPSWWQDPELKSRVVDQLKLCLAVLESTPTDEEPH